MSESSDRASSDGKVGDYSKWVGNLILTTMAIVLVVLVGWIFHIEPMKRILPGLTSMNPLTAITMGGAAAALWVTRIRRPGGGKAVIAALSGLLVLYVGAAKLFDLATGTTFCPDALFFASQLDFGQQYPSRIAPNVAACFAILGVALLTADRPALPSWLQGQWLVTPILITSFVAIVGYAYNASGLYAYRQFIPMALHSAICFVLLSISLILKHPDQGYLRLLPRGSPGARSYAQWLPACILIPVLVGGLHLFAAHRGWLATYESGSAIVAVLTILALAVFAFLSCVALNRTDAVRRRAEAQLERMVEELDCGNKALMAEVAERKRLEEEAKHQASHDPLTGLPNRLLFVDRLQHTISQAVRHRSSCALFYVDIDNFKPVNDLHGHQAGDALLKSLARRMTATVRDVDMVARLGGDEFAVIMDSPADYAEAQGLARRICERVTAPHDLEDVNLKDVRVGVSIGIAVFPGHATDIDALVRQADIAMYQAKVDGKNQGLSANIMFASAAES